MDPIDIGVITVRGPDYHPTRRLIEAAAQRGCRILPMHPYRIWPACLNGQPALIGHPEVAQIRAVMPRQGAEIKDACLPLIAHFEQMGLAVINTRKAIEGVRNKYAALQTLTAARLPVVDTIFINAREGLAAVWQHFGPEVAVVKPVSGRQGANIALFKQGDRLTDGLNAELDRGRGLLFQRFISPRGRSDLRVLVVGGRVAGAMALTPPAGEFRANYHLGAAGRSIRLAPEVEALALQAVRVMDLKIAGVDLMIDSAQRTYINEVNYAPGFRGLEAVTGRDMAGVMIDYVMSVVRNKT